MLSVYEGKVWLIVMKKELEKKYNPHGMEDRIYADWMDKKYFHAEVDKEKKPFTIVIPPPNITGQLHMGHALDNTMQDIIIRFKRMQGFNALWQPGTDHASIATEVKIIERLKEEGIQKADLGREKFLERAWDWKEEYGGRIIEQLKKLGSSCDWERERFTMDEGCSKAVEEVFVKMYEKKMIYKGSKIINWCPVCKTTISDAEVEYSEQQGNFWHIQYPILGTSEALTFATTRPETMLGDTAVAVNPKDKRYTHLIGKTVLIPLVGREIPVIADDYVDMEFGTGVVKITPAHDPNDFEVGKRHNLQEINIMNDDATINHNGGQFEGLDRYEARKQIVTLLDQQGYLQKIEKHVHNVGTHDRCKTTIEPLVKQQWFVKMEELIKPAVEAVKNKEIELVPERMEKIYFNWTDNIRDWCISRQLWWGHRIPAYYCEQCGEIHVQKDKPLECRTCKSSEIVQDPDTLDTWFSSALWPFSTLGWPEKTEELEYFYPTDVLVTGYDIIFFWVIRMIFSGYEHLGERPFKTVLFHGLIRDSQGRKMSKSLGNGIDPLEIISQYGADALRLTLITGNAPGNDMRFYVERVEASRNFANKVWNASRFILMNMEEEVFIPDATTCIFEPVDKWIISKLNTLVNDVTNHMEQYDLGIAVQKVYDFIWDDFCDWYIEMVKPRLYSETDVLSKTAALITLKMVLVDALKLLHPFMPFITEEIFTSLQSEEDSIMISQWPTYKPERYFVEEEKNIAFIQETIRGIRTVRANMNVAPSKKAQVIVVTNSSDVTNIFKQANNYIKPLAMANEVIIQTDQAGIGSDAVSVVVKDATIYIPFEQLVDLEQEKVRLKKEEEKLQAEITRASKMLANDNFMSRASSDKVEEEKEKLNKYTQMLDQILERMKQL